MTNWFNYILTHHHHLFSWFLLVVLLYMLSMILAHSTTPYINNKYNTNFNNLTHIVQSIFNQYGTHIYSGMLLLYMCYWCVIICTKLGCDIYTWYGHTISLIITWKLELNYMDMGVELGYIQIIDHTPHGANIANNMNIGGEQIVKSVTPFKNIRIPAGLLKDFADMDHARKDFEIMPHLVLPEIDLVKNSKYVEYLQFVHDKFLLHELKKSHPQFAHKELIHVNTLTYQDYSKFNVQQTNVSKERIDLIPGIPDAMVYDTLDHTYTTIQYKFSCGNNFRKFKLQDFAIKYNHITHVMKIMLAHSEKFKTLEQIIWYHNRNFDTWIYQQPEYTKIHKNPVLLNILEQMADSDQKFMVKQGDQIKHDFCRKFVFKDYTNFKHDRVFTHALHQFEKTYAQPHSVIVPSSNMNNNIK